MAFFILQHNQAFIYDINVIHILMFGVPELPLVIEYYIFINQANQH